MNHQPKPQEGNLTNLKDFVLLGFSDVPNLQWLLFGLLLAIYSFIILGNGTIVLLTKVDSALQTPMYFFLGNFSFLEICFVSITLPRMVFNLGTQRRTISFIGCATQMCCTLILGATECFLLAVMSYDRYIAICNPLRYPLVMNQRVCSQLVIGSWISGMPVQIGQTSQIFSLSFCGSNEINHFFCDIPPILHLACGDTFINELMVFLGAALFSFFPLLLIVFSYSKIISAVLKLASAKSRAKAFSTCSSHLAVVMLFFGSGMITYFRSNTSHSGEIDKVISLFYTVVTPMFNPMVYSLRNKDVTIALRKFLCKQFVKM
ncbi:olfactory receptor Olr562 [Rattus norvegicus]|uniref:Olfactory receptor n=1 Tax=Rattus norvegicus TaxID=10116 RepID=D4A846_RAT|nr:olfactory receptor Olr562 [Rattus norvegicus]|eukprot:NP_001000667.1 olfactory receptor Olr562 [Rattus norvegicus]